ncbi:MAG: SAM hydrolase/SAM-dependent halogenase family protein [Gemmatimonadota bacterium]
MAIITLLTDFGTRDAYVAEVKGVLLSEAREVTLVDVSHDVPPGDVTAAAYLLSRTWRRFPAGTVHLVVVDPGVGTSRRPVAFVREGHRFVGPDNGVFSRVLEAGEEPEGVVLPVADEAAPTFHGRDVFAPAAAALAAGAAIVDMGRPLDAPLTRLPEDRPVRDGGRLVGRVAYVDRFGNLITNLRPDDVPVRAALRLGSTLLGPMRRTFGDVAPGELLAYPGSGGELEIAVRDGSAALTLGVGVGAPVVVEPA